MLRPAPYSKTDSAEFDAITVLRTLVSSKTVKLDVKERDKIPNVDGTAELVDEGGYPLGKVEVQVRKIPTGQLWYDCETELFAYSKIATLPVLLVCVDVEAKRAFWRQVSVTLPNFKPDQKSSRLKFDPIVDSIGSATPYLTRWQEVVADYQARISEYPTLKKRLDEEVGLASIEKPDVLLFQTFIEKINHLLDADFGTVKEQFFADVWKLGVGIHATTPERVHFQIYAIQKGANAPLVSSFVGKPLEGFFRPAVPNVVAAWISGSGSTIQMSWTNRTHFKDPELEARNFVLSYVKKMLEQKRFQIAGNLLSTEYLFWFLDRYHHCLGLPLADSYEITSVNYAVRVFLPAWYFLAQRRFFEINKDLIPPGVFPSFESIAGMWPATERPTHEQVEDLLKSGRRIPPTFVSTQFFSLRSLWQSLDYLMTSGEQKVNRPYRPRTSRPIWLWDGYKAGDRLQNVETVLRNAVHEYQAFVKANSLLRLESKFLSDNNALVYLGEVSAWEGRDQWPNLKTFLVDNRDRKLPKVSVVQESSQRVKVTERWEKLVIDGLERDVLYGMHGGATDLFHDFPTLLVVYDFLKRDLAQQYGLK